MIVFNATEMTFQVFQRALHLQAQESMNHMNYPLGHRKMGRISTTKSIEGLLLDLHGFTWIYQVRVIYSDSSVTRNARARVTRAAEHDLRRNATRGKDCPALAITYFAELCGNSK